MIPLSLFLIIWLVLLGVYAILAFFSVIQMLRYGVAGPMSVFSTGIFLVVAVLVIAGTGLYLLTVDWSLGIEIGGLTDASFLTP